LINFNKDAEQSAGLDSCKVYLRDYVEDSTNENGIKITNRYAYFYLLKLVMVNKKRPPGRIPKKDGDKAMNSDDE
jgi:hypothetical protein